MIKEYDYCAIIFKAPTKDFVLKETLKKIRSLQSTLTVSYGYHKGTGDLAMFINNDYAVSPDQQIDLLQLQIMFPDATLIIDSNEAFELFENIAFRQGYHKVVINY